MLNNGYSLSRVELLNWGNFHGYQKFSLHEPNLNGPLFAGQPASAILGINGSGKSTLIDALMIALLPFEGSVKLGVTNDVEAGNSGGRTVKDYVLGKHSSTGGVIADPNSIFGRKDGCSIVLLSFSHNRQPAKVLSFGRMWWYQNHKVSETQLAFHTYGSLRLQDLCPSGKTPATAKIFRQHLRSTLPNVQVFETMQSYFTALSQGLGRISRDDLKILNRAFFVKSISNIDQFIRENMLVEQESPNVERLMENVRNGKEIAFSIETCEAKIAAVSKVLRELNRLRSFTEIAESIDGRLRLLSLHREWSELRDLLKQCEDLRRELAEAEHRLPLAKRQAEEADRHAKAVQMRLSNDDVEGRLSSIRETASALQDKISWMQRTLERWNGRAQTVMMKLPVGTREWDRFIENIDAKIELVQTLTDELERDIEVLRETKFSLEASGAELRQELKHFSQNRTFPRDMHSLKANAIRALKLPVGHLAFVGELLQVKRQHLNFRHVIEAVLFPVAKNLLCHPDSLHEFTRWLDTEGLPADIVVKRIDRNEITASVGGEQRVTALSESSILHMIEVRPEGEHYFFHYLSRLLRSTFDYSLSDVKHFKLQNERLVTVGGLVKKDQSTMRKPEKDFSFLLGWDNSEMIEKLTSDLSRLNIEHASAVSSLQDKVAMQHANAERERLLLDIKQGYPDVAGLESDGLQLKNLEKETADLLNNNPNYKALREEAIGLELQAQGLMRGLLTLESDKKIKSERLQKIENLLPAHEKNIKESKLFCGLAVELGDEKKLDSALSRLDDELREQAKTRFQMEDELKEAAQKNELARRQTISQAATHLNNYRHQFNDVNLSYEMNGEFSLNHFIAEWSAAEKRLRDTELPGAQDKWKKFFDQVLMDSVKDTINELKSRLHEVSETILSINEVLKLTNFEDLVNEQRYLRIEVQSSMDERIRKFRKGMVEVEKTLSPTMRLQIIERSQEIMSVLLPFIEEFHKDPSYRTFVTDVRNHFQFSVQSLRREPGGMDCVVEIFSGARKDAKSSAQTTQLAYALLASCLAFRFHFHDPVAGAETPRLIVLDEFGGKFDNEKPREILTLLDKMGFQSVLVSPMSKADLLADGISHLVLVHKVSASRSKVQSYRLSSRADYDRLLAGAVNIAATDLSVAPAGV